MSTKEQALYIFNQLTDEQLAAFVTLFGEKRIILQEIPDSWDREMIEAASEDNSEAVDFDDFVKELGFDPYELQNQD